MDTKKSTDEEIDKVKVKSRKIAEGLKLEDQMQNYSKTEAFIKLKDHKKNFVSRPECRLINTAKNDLGRVVKIKLERINSEIRYKTNVNQWQSTQAALKWFNEVTNPN